MYENYYQHLRISQDRVKEELRTAKELRHLRATSRDQEAKRVQEAELDSGELARSWYARLVVVLRSALGLAEANPAGTRGA